MKRLIINVMLTNLGIITYVINVEYMRYKQLLKLERESWNVEIFLVLVHINGCGFFTPSI